MYNINNIIRMEEVKISCWCVVIWGGGGLPAGGGVVTGNHSVYWEGRRGVGSKV